MNDDRQPPAGRRNLVETLDDALASSTMTDAKRAPIKALRDSIVEAGDELLVATHVRRAFQRKGWLPTD